MSRSGKKTLPTTTDILQLIEEREVLDDGKPFQHDTKSAKPPTAYAGKEAMADLDLGGPINLLLGVITTFGVMDPVLLNQTMREQLFLPSSDGPC